MKTVWVFILSVRSDEEASKFTGNNVRGVECLPILSESCNRVARNAFELSELPGLQWLGYWWSRIFRSPVLAYLVTLFRVTWRPYIDLHILWVPLVIIPCPPGDCSCSPLFYFILGYVRHACNVGTGGVRHFLWSHVFKLSVSYISPIISNVPPGDHATGAVVKLEK